VRTDFIRTALKVAQTSNMAKAADELFMAQTSVRNEMHILEKELGFQLFERTRSKTNPMVLTEQGAKWLVHARRALELLDQGAVPVEIRRSGAERAKRKQRKAS
jgi:DNA-binding transcriptional LysR family regulator